MLVFPSVNYVGCIHPSIHPSIQPAIHTSSIQPFSHPAIHSTVNIEQKNAECARAVVNTRPTCSWTHVYPSAFFQGNYDTRVPTISYVWLPRSPGTWLCVSPPPHNGRRYAHAVLNHWGLAVTWRLPQIRITRLKYVHVHTHTPFLLKWLLTYVHAHMHTYVCIQIGSNAYPPMTDVCMYLVARVYKRNMLAGHPKCYWLEYGPYII